MYDSFLTTLLEQNRRYSPLYGDRLANHLSMAVIALAELGASDARLRDFFDAYAPNLDRMSSKQPEPPILSPADHLGREDQFPSFRRFFAHQISKIGADAALREWLPVLIPGLSGSGFHGMIRTAYAVISGDDDELAFSMAYWACTYQSLGPVGHIATISCRDIADRLYAADRFAPLTDGIIADRLRWVSERDAFRNAANEPASLRLVDIAAFAARALYSEEDFTLLHAVTACHAFRVLSRHVDDTTEALPYLWQAVLCAALSRGPINWSTPPSPETNDDWLPCIEAATVSDDAHVIKRIYTCLQEAAVYPGFPYFEVARRCVL